MSKAVFGTDGIRGGVNQGSVTPDMMLAIGKAIGSSMTERAAHHGVLIGRDTRQSGEMIEAALIAGLSATGANVLQAGCVPTPAVGMLTKSLRASMGIMITASHNPYTDNGIKLFGSDGFKINDDVQKAIEARLSGGADYALADAERITRPVPVSAAADRYIEAAKRTLPTGLDLSGLKVVVDCANGAGYDVGPRLLWELGAQVDMVGVEPDGLNINFECGAMHPETLAETVLDQRADVGIALDGDADRLIMCDETGRIIDGDQILAAIAMEMQEAGTLTGGGVVATIMSNLGLEAFLEGKGLKLIRTAVGDRHVVAKMRSDGYNLGGEQSGHMILTDHVTTGDGLVSALQVLATLKRTGRKASEVLSCFEPAPQKLINVRYGKNDPLSDPSVKGAIADLEASLGSKGRVVIRKSGTEPVIRVMVEAHEQYMAEKGADALADLVEDWIKTNG